MISYIRLFPCTYEIQLKIDVSIFIHVRNLSINIDYFATLTWTRATVAAICIRTYSIIVTSMCLSAILMKNIEFQGVVRSKFWKPFKSHLLSKLRPSLPAKNTVAFDRKIKSNSWNHSFKSHSSKSKHWNPSPRYPGLHEQV